MNFSFQLYTTLRVYKDIYRQCDTWIKGTSFPECHTSVTDYKFIESGTSVVISVTQQMQLTDAYNTWQRANHQNSILLL